MIADEYLYEVLDSQALGDDSDEIKALQKHRAEVETVLCDHFKDSSPTIRYAGSKAKGTMNGSPMTSISFPILRPGMPAPARPFRTSTKTPERRSRRNISSSRRARRYV